MSERGSTPSTATGAVEVSRPATDNDGPEYPTGGDVATATSLSRLRALDALAVLLDSDSVRAVRRADGAVGFAPADDESSGCDTIKF